MSNSFKIKLPNGVNFDLYYNTRKQGFDNRKERLIEQVLDKWEDYCNDHWIYHGKVESYKYNHEDNVKNLLDRAATFLLLGEFRDGMLISDYKQEKINEFEKVLSSLGSDIQEYMCGIDFNESYNSGNLNDLNLLLSEDGVFLTGDFDIDVETISEIKFNNRGRKSNVEKNIHNYKKKQNTYWNKINKIFNTEDLDLWNLYNLRNKDLCRLNNINADDIVEFKDNEHKKKWLNKLSKNIFGEVIQEYRIKKIKGNKGLIDKNKSYEYKWCYVDTDNIFEHKGNKYQIENSVTQYKVGFDNQCEMDMIFVIEQEGKIYYFDMNLDQILNNLITL